MRIDEQTIKYAANKFSSYWTKDFIEKYKSGKVPILIEGFLTYVVYVDRDERGYPVVGRYMDFVTMERMPFNFEEIKEIPDTVECKRNTITITEAYSVISDGYDRERPIVFMWKGSLLESEGIPLTELNPKYLLQLAQKAIKQREPIMLDKVNKNKLYI